MRFLYGPSILLLSLFLVEAGVRLLGIIPEEARWYLIHPHLGWHPRPHIESEQTSEGHSQIRLNASGFRGKEREHSKAQEVFRVAIIGDSFVEAFQVEEADTFPVRAESLLAECLSVAGKKPEILSFGVKGYGTAQELILYREEVAAYHPDVVVLAFFAGNDIYNNHPLLNPTNPEIAPIFQLGEKSNRSSEIHYPFSDSDVWWLGLRNNSHIAQIAWKLIGRWGKSPARLRQDSLRKELGEFYQDWLVYTPERIPELTESWVVTSELLKKFRDQVRADNAHPLLLLVPGAIELQPESRVREEFIRAYGLTSLDIPRERLAQISVQLELENLDLLPPLRARLSQEKQFFYGFPNTKLGIGHWNENGHREVATVLAKRLCEVAQRKHAP